MPWGTLRGQKSRRQGAPGEEIQVGHTRGECLPWEALDREEGKLRRQWGCVSKSRNEVGQCLPWTSELLSFREDFHLIWFLLE